MDKIVCPLCHHPVSSGASNSWKFGSYKVRRFLCPNCKKRFNLYEGPKGSYTIPKSK